MACLSRGHRTASYRLIWPQMLSEKNCTWDRGGGRQVVWRCLPGRRRSSVKKGSNSYRRDEGIRTGCSMPQYGHVLITYCRFMVYSNFCLPRLRHVSVLSPSVAPRGYAGGLSDENCRYDGDYEEAMGIQEKGHQGMVVRVVRRRQEKSQGFAEQGTGRALPPYEVCAAQL